MAHIDASIALQQIDIAKRYPLKRRELNDLIAAFNEILNKYAYMYSATTMEIGIPYKSGLKILWSSSA